METAWVKTRPAEAPAQTMAPDEMLLWHSLASGDAAAREALVERHLPLVKTEVARVAAYLPTYVDRQELQAEGIMGLLTALAHFQLDVGVSFPAYARKRVWGSIVDRVRTLNGVPRSACHSAKRISQAIVQFLNTRGRQPDETELAGQLGLSVAELHDLERTAALAQVLSLDVRPETDPEGESACLAMQLEDRREEAAPPLWRLAEEERRALLVEGLKGLPERERAVLVLHYYQDLQLREIALAMEVSESRISQLHNRALARLRAFILCAEAAGLHPKSADRRAG